MTETSTSGPKRIVIVGGGLAGLVAADEITKALAAAGPPAGAIEVIVVEDGRMGRGAPCFDGDDPAVRALHPSAPKRAPRSTSPFLVGAEDEAFGALCDELGLPLLPARASSSCFAWLGPPDVEGARVVELHVVDPGDRDSAREPRARALHALFLEGGAAATWLVDVLARFFQLEVRPLPAWLPLLDVLFCEELSPWFRWGAVVLVDLAARGEHLGCAEAGELLLRLVEERLVHGFIAAEEAREQVGHHTGEVRKLLRDDEQAAGALAGTAPLLELLTRDARHALERGFDPSSSSLLPLFLGGGLAHPFGLDAKAALAHLARRGGAPAGARARVVDGGDLDAVLRVLAERVRARFDDGSVAGRVLDDTWSARFLPFGAALGSVEVTDNVDRIAGPVPTVDAPRAGIATDTLEADVIVSSHSPVELEALLNGVEQGAALSPLARASEELISLQLFFAERRELFPPGDEAFALTGLEGPFSYAVDLGRAWSKRALDVIALEGDGKRRPRGSAFELVGAWPSLFWPRGPAPVEKAPWSPAKRELCARLAEDALDYEPWSVDARTPRIAPELRAARAPMLGQVSALARARYLERWIEEVAPLVVAAALEQLAQLPGLDAQARRALAEDADLVGRHENPRLSWILRRRCQAQERAPSIEPLEQGRRPPAGEAFHGLNLFLAGGFTVVESGSCGLEAEVVAARLAARAALDAIRRGGVGGLS